MTLAVVNERSIIADRSRVVGVHIRPLKHFKTLYGVVVLYYFEVPRTSLGSTSLKMAFTHRHLDILLVDNLPFLWLLSLFDEPEDEHQMPVVL